MASGLSKLYGDHVEVDRINHVVRIVNHDGSTQGLKLGSTLVTSTGSELNILDGVTSSAAELNYNDITTLGTGAASKAVVLDAGEDYTWPATGVLTYGVLKDSAATTLGATAAELNAAADVSARLVNIGDVTTYALLVANSGKPHIIPDLTSGLTMTLPAEASGLEYEFIYAGVAADAVNWIITSESDTNYFLGGLVHLDTDAGDTGDEIVPIAGDGNSNSKLTIVTPNVGTRLHMVCDGTRWILSGSVVSATVPSFADQ